jgi:hypothetical protein
MNRLLASLGLAAALAGVVFPIGSYAAAQPSPSMSVSILSSTGPRTITKPQNVTFHLKVSGMTLDSRHMGKANVSGHGHLQVYANRIPADAYSKKDLKHNWLASLADPTFTLKLSSAVLGGKGKHKIIVALAKNNSVLYHAPTASFTITVR